MTAVILAQTEEFTLKGEFLWFGVILHCDVHVKWSKGVRERLKQTIRETVSSIKVPAYAFQSNSHDPKKRKFIKDMGGILHHKRLTGDGEWAEMYLFLPWT